ncbi:hypothetical protein P8C59_006011 [Phyllachora maydis]|uniref:BTB domain-containing protein n=1 Tax=Phyllachora maydis TaxID=1825666 RepID=A0AAD9I791_9PEZI|nr:hypothetical protein P8C59_006011 [Phyllachora maydis]
MLSPAYGVDHPTSTTAAFTVRTAPASVVGATGHLPNHQLHHHRAPGSRASSRTRRYNRSHAGGAAGGSSIAQNEFPVFRHSGDVDVVVRVPTGHENRYLLHRHTLTRCSGFFEASTSREWSRALVLPPVGDSRAVDRPKGGLQLAVVEERSAQSSSDESCAPAVMAPVGLGPPKRRWRYELDWGKDVDDIPMLVQKEAHKVDTAVSTSPNSLFGGPSSFFWSMASLSLSSSHRPPAQPPPRTLVEEDVLRDYDNLFRIMYNYPPLLDAINIADAYVQCKSLLTLADQYDALAVVGPRVDHHLLQFQSRLWKQIAKYPISYLRLGFLARSKVMFQEALVHVVGQWPAGERCLRAALPDAVLDLIEDKVDELDEAVGRVEARLFRLNLTTRSGERVAPATNYLDWLVVSLFRQWLAENITPPPPPSPVPVPDRTPGARPLPGRAYRTLGGVVTGAAAAPYLGHDECKRFLKLTPDLYSRDQLRRFEKRVDELKALAREAVRPLLGSGLELEMGPGARSDAAAGIGYLTCTVLADRDLPWHVYD